METLFQEPPQGGEGGGGSPESPIDVFGDISDLSDGFSHDGPDPRRERTGETADVAGGNTAGPGKGSAPEVAQSDDPHPPDRDENEEPRPAWRTATTARKDRNKWDFTKTHPGARYENGKWLPPKDHDEHLPIFLDDVSWDEEYMEERARAVSDAKKKKRDSENQGPGSGSEEPEGRGAGTSGPRTRCTAVLMSLLMVLGVFVIVHDASGWQASCRTCLRSVLEPEPKTACTQTDPSSTPESEAEEESDPTTWDLWAEEFQELVDGPWV